MIVWVHHDKHTKVNSKNKEKKNIVDYYFSTGILDLNVFEAHFKIVTGI